MAVGQTVTVGDRIIEFHSFTGEVVDEKLWATTQVSGGGGGINAGSGQPNPVTISSTTTTHNQFFLRNDAGQEKAFEITEIGVALRKGHRVTVLWGIVKGNERGPYLAVYNHSTGDLTPIASGVSTLAVVPLPTSLLVAYIACVLGICVYGLGLIALVVVLFRRSKQKKRMYGGVRAAVDGAIAQMRNEK